MVQVSQKFTKLVFDMISKHKNVDVTKTNTAADMNGLMCCLLKVCHVEKFMQLPDSVGSPFAIP